MGESGRILKSALSLSTPLLVHYSIPLLIVIVSPKSLHYFPALEPDGSEVLIFIVSLKNVQISHFLGIIQILEFKGQKFVPRKCVVCAMAW